MMALILFVVLIGFVGTLIFWSLVCKRKPSKEGRKSKYTWIKSFMFLRKLSIFLNQHKIHVVKHVLEYSFPEKQWKKFGVEGLKIVQISDLHLDENNDYYSQNTKLFQEAIDVINKETPDVVVLTGDLTQQFSPLVAKKIRDSLAKRIRCENVFICFGSHDLISPKRVCVEKLRAVYEKPVKDRPVKIKVLNNESFFPFKDRNIRFLGFGSFLRKDCKVTKGMGTAEDFRNFFTVSLSHNPDSYKSIEKVGTNLTISGHTHCGQICFPCTKYPVLLFLFRCFACLRMRKNPFKSIHAVVKNWKYGNGLFSMGKNSNLVVNRGLGSHLNIRFFCRPEVTLLTFRNQETKSKP